VGGAGSGERTAEVAEVAGKKSGAQRCRRCCGDIAAAGEIGCEKIVRMRPGSELSVRETGGDEDEGGEES
jgi:hypothetical protein